MAAEKGRKRKGQLTNLETKNGIVFMFFIFLLSFFATDACIYPFPKYLFHVHVFFYLQLELFPF